MISDGLEDLISLQNNLKVVKLIDYKNKDKIIPLLVKNSFSLTKLTLFGCEIDLAFIAVFKNLQELNLCHQDFNNSITVYTFFTIKDFKVYMHKIYKIKFCPNLKNLCTPFKNDESETLKLILNNCQYLEIIKVHEWFNGKTIFKVLANYPQKYFMV
ncbi:unnamed protein product [Rhizophagus irregularis]|nr:unnamed protein product [Rhizophagus irregularis]